MKKVKYILLTLTMVLGGNLVAASARALTETREVDVQFTFNSVLEVTLSSEDIVIADLVPGGMRNSNEIGITVNTNNVSGYTLSATVGDADNDSRDLLHTGGVASFSSIDTTANLAGEDTDTGKVFSGPDSTWGYSIDSGVSFSGLPIYSGVAKELKSSNGAANETTNFLIGAKAATGQLSGDYMNVINFYAVPKVTE